MTALISKYLTEMLLERLSSRGAGESAWRLYLAQHPPRGRPTLIAGMLIDNCGILVSLYNARVVARVPYTRRMIAAKSLPSKNVPSINVQLLPFSSLLLRCLSPARN